MPRVLRIMNRFNLGGPTYNAAYLTRFLPGKFETLLVGGANEASEKNSQFILQQLGIEARIIPYMQRSVSVGMDRKAYIEIKKIIKEFRPDIVHTHASKAGALGRIAALHSGVRVIVHTFHGHVFDSYFNKIKTSFYINIERLLARHSSGIIALSEAQKYDLSEKYRICPGEKIRIIPLGFDLSRFRENSKENRAIFRKKYDIGDDEIAIGIIGRIVPVKNHMMFLKAIKSLTAENIKKVRAFIIGDGESKEQVAEAAQQLGIEYVCWNEKAGRAFLTFTGWETNMEQVNAGMDIIALTSDNEGTPVNIIEAQAAGKPVVCTRVGGVQDVVLPGKTAILVEKNDHQAMADALNSLAENQELREELSRPGWDHVKEKYHYLRLVSDISNYYDELLG